jgi:hypothetical protein
LLRAQIFPSVKCFAFFESLMIIRISQSLTKLPRLIVRSHAITKHVMSSTLK